MAKEPIKCWKIFEIKNGSCYGPFTKYNFGMIVPGKVLEPSFGEHILYSIAKRWFPWLYRKIFEPNEVIHRIFGKITYNKKYGWWDISDGYIHTLSKIPTELEAYCTNAGQYELWECEIPTNTVYFKADCRGSHYEAADSYASKQIKLIKRINKLVKV